MREYVGDGQSFVGQIRFKSVIHLVWLNSNKEIYLFIYILQRWNEISGATLVSWWWVKQNSQTKYRTEQSVTKEKKKETKGKAKKEEKRKQHQWKKRMIMRIGKIWLQRWWSNMQARIWIKNKYKWIYIKICTYVHMYILTIIIIISNSKQRCNNE